MSKKFDVAISFLAPDENIARRFYDELSKELEVFFFPEAQKHLAGTDGMESMRTAFYQDSHLNLVLYRERWGQTDWTALEYQAIENRCKKDRFKSLFLVYLDKKDQLPLWLPDNYVRFNMEDFSFEQAIGAIKMRVQEQGAVLQPLTAQKMAERHKADVDFAKLRTEWLRSTAGIYTAKERVLAIFQELELKAKPIAAALGTQIMVESSWDVCVMQSERASLNLVWKQQFANVVENVHLECRAFQGKLPLRGQMSWNMEKRYPVSVISYKAEYWRDGTFDWMDKKGRRLNTDEVTEFCLQQMIAAMDKPK
jgi:TIR domain